MLSNIYISFMSEHTKDAQSKCLSLIWMYIQCLLSSCTLLSLLLMRVCLRRPFYPWWQGVSEVSLGCLSMAWGQEGLWAGRALGTNASLAQLRPQGLRAQGWEHGSTHVVWPGDCVWTQISLLVSKWFHIWFLRFDISSVPCQHPLATLPREMGQIWNKPWMPDFLFDCTMQRIHLPCIFLMVV